MEKGPDSLIIGYLQNRLQKKDVDQFFAWIEKSEKNKRLFFELKTIYESAGAQIDTEKSWQKLLDKHRKQNRATRYSGRNSFRIPFLRYAAVAAVAVLITSICFLGIRLQPAKDSLSAGTVRYMSGNGLTANTLELPDGTRVKLGASSLLSYHTDYGRNMREVELTGEAYFDVAKIKARPFVVKTPGLDITALGTQFNVMAYPGDSIISTTLVEGSVSLDAVSLSGLVLLPGQQLTYGKVSQAVRLVDNIDVAAVTSWISGYYYFHGETFDKMLHRMGNIHDVQFVVTSERLNKMKFSGTFYSGQRIREILEIIRISIPFEYRIEDDKIFVSE